MPIVFVFVAILAVLFIPAYCDQKEIEKTKWIEKGIVVESTCVGRFSSEADCRFQTDSGFLGQTKDSLIGKGDVVVCAENNTSWCRRKE